MLLRGFFNCNRKTFIITNARKKKVDKGYFFLIYFFLTNETELFFKCITDSLLRKKINSIVSTEIIKQSNFIVCTTTKTRK